jgi:hypothetical protein
MSTNDRCLILAQQGADDPKSVERFIQDALAEAKMRVNGDDSRVNTELMRVISERAQEADIEAASKEIALARSMTARARMSSVFDGFIGAGFKRTTALAESVAEAGNKAVLAGRRASANWDYELSSLGLDTYLLDKSNHRNILLELAEINKTNGSLGITGDKNAAKIAELFQTKVDAGRAVFADNGIFVRNLEGRMLRQAFTRESLLLRGEDAFARDMTPRINRERVFNRPADEVSPSEVDAMLRGVYREITGGEDVDVPFSNGMYDAIPTYKNRATRHRQLHLNNVDDTMHVMDAYGEGNMVGIMLNTIEQTHKNAALIDEMGPSPRNTLEYLKAFAKTGADEGDRAAINDPSPLKPWNNADLIMDVVDGALHRNGDAKIRMWTGTINNFFRGTMLQGVLLSSLPDLGTSSAAMARIGQSGAKSVATRLSVATRGLSQDDLKMFGGIADAISSHHIGTMQNLVAGDSATAKMANASTRYANAVMKYGGQNWWTREGKQAAAFGYANAVPRFGDSSWGELNKSFRDTLLRGGVLEDDWNFIRGNMESLTHDIGGHNTFVNERILDMPDDTFMVGFNLSKAEAVRYKRKLYNSMEAATKSFVDDSIVTPGVRERAVLSMGQGDGTIMGSIRAFTTSLLSYPVAYMFRAMGRDLRLGGAGAAKASAYLAATAIFYGYMSAAVHDLARGRTRDWLTDDIGIQAKNFMDAAGRGGLGGIFGGFVSAQLLYGESPFGIPGGAPLGFIDDTVNSFMRSGNYLIDGETEKAAANMAKTMRQMVPFSNLPGIRVAFDHMVYYPILEMTDPNALTKIERNWQKRVDGDYIFEQKSIWN